MKLSVFVFTFLLSALAYSNPILDTKALSEGFEFQSAQDFSKVGKKVVRYWICSDKPADLIKKCENLGKDELGQHYAYLDVSLKTKKLTHTFSTRHGIDYGYCFEYVDKINKFFSQSKNYCILAEQFSPSSIKSSDKEIFSIFIKIKNQFDEAEL